MLSIDEMIKMIEEQARDTHMPQTLAALPFAIKKHDGQYRKGNDRIPYIVHPLQIACHAISLGLCDDELLATILLHDVCEDCFDEVGEHIRYQDLPVSDAVKEAVRLVTKPVIREEKWEEKYYLDIRVNKLAIVTKLLDRCHNISSMAKVYSPQKMAEYIDITEKYVMPYINVINEQYPELNNIMFVVGYHMESLINALK